MTTSSDLTSRETRGVGRHVSADEAWVRVDRLSRMVIQERAFRQGESAGLAAAADDLKEFGARMADVASLAFLDCRPGAEGADVVTAIRTAVYEAVAPRARPITDLAAVQADRAGSVAAAFVGALEELFGMDVVEAAEHLSVPALSSLPGFPLGDVDGMRESFVAMFLETAEAP